MGNILKKPKFLIFLLTAVILLVVVFCYFQNQEPIQAQGTAYYVTQNGSNDRNGLSYANSWSVANWNERVLENTHNGDTIYFCGNISDEVKVRWGGTAAGHVVYEGGGDGGSCTATTIDRNYDGDDFKFCIAARDRAENISYYTIQNFVLKNVGGGPLQWNNHCVWLQDGGSSHIIIDNVDCLDDKGTLHQRAAGIEILGPDYVQVKNCTITDMGFGIVLRKVDYYYLYNNTIIRPNWCDGTDCKHGTGISIASVGGSGDQCNYGRILNNTVQGYYVDTNTHTGVGIQIARANHTLLKGNTLSNCGQPGHQWEGYEDGVAQMRYHVAEDNIYYDNGNRYNGWEPGVWIDEGQDIVFQRNKLYSNNLGVNITQSEHVIFRYNQIYDTNNTTSGQDATQGNTICGKPENNIDYGADYMIYNNTFYNNGKSDSWRGEMYLYGGDMRNPVVFKNNIISNSQHDYLVHLEDSQTGAPIFDYNYYYRAPGKSYMACDADVEGVVCRSDQSKITWAEWITDENQDAHSTYSESAQPLFVNAASGDFALQSISPCINSGTHLTQTNGSGTGSSFKVDDARYFAGNMGIVDGTGWEYIGDVIMIGSDEATIISVNYDTNTITVENSFTWVDGENVNLKYDFAKNEIIGTPDIGALEYQSEQSTCFLPDLICNQSINLDDFTLFKTYFQTQNPNADFNNDSIVSAQDLGIMMSTWGSY